LNWDLKREILMFNEEDLWGEQDHGTINYGDWGG